MLLFVQRIHLSILIVARVWIEHQLAVVLRLLSIPRTLRLWLTVPDSSLAKLIRLIHHPTSPVIGFSLPNCLTNDVGTVVGAKLVIGVAWESFRLLHNTWFSTPLVLHLLSWFLSSNLMRLHFLYPSPKIAYFAAVKHFKSACLWSGRLVYNMKWFFEKQKGVDFSEIYLYPAVCTVCVHSRRWKHSSRVVVFGFCEPTLIRGCDDKASPALGHKVVYQYARLPLAPN